MSKLQNVPLAAALWWVVALTTGIGCGTSESEAADRGATGGTAGVGGPGASAGSAGNAGSAGTAGSAGSAGNSGSAGATGCSPPCRSSEECWDDTRCVAKAVPFPKGYSIDATEVTRAQYAAWLATNPPLGNQPAQCVWNTSFEPERALPIFGCDDEVWPPGAKADHPVVCVDWCDASAYCAAVGKRLCGRIGGGANGFEDFADPGKSQWFAACRSDAGNTYPYGDTYEEQTCNGYHRTDTGCGGSGSCITVEAGSLPGCQSKTPGYEGVYDLSGNVWEWEDSCSESTGSEDFCRLRGGSKAQADLGLTCDMEFGEGYARDSVSDTAGFRCCKD